MTTDSRNLSPYSSSSVTLIVSALHYVLSITANRLAQMFEGNGAELPWLTQFLIKDSVFYWIVPALIIAGFVAHHLGYLSRGSILLMSSVGTIFSIVISVIGLYLPLFQLGGLVQP